MRTASPLPLPRRALVLRLLAALLAVLTAAAALPGCRDGGEGEVLVCGTGFTCADGFTCSDGACVALDAGPTDAAPGDTPTGEAGGAAADDDAACAEACPGES